MIYQKKLIFIRLLSFILFIGFGINIILGQYLNLTWAIYFLLAFLIINVFVAVWGYKRIGNYELTLSANDDKTNKFLLGALIVIWLVNYIIGSQTIDIKELLHLLTAILMMVVAVVGIVVQALVLKRKA